jgi:hypothetical protein
MNRFRQALTRRPAAKVLLGLGLGLAPAALSGCANLPREHGAQPATATVAALLTGHFTSAGQAKADPEFFEVHLHMCPIWTERDDGPWLYVEQAMATALDKPYRQRIYRLVDRSTAGSPSVESRVYELPNAAERVGACSDPARFAADSPESLVAREGCAIVLAPGADASWSGSTVGDLCLSSLRGASYATSEVWLSSAELRTWDRGFDANRAQVWGAKKGPYVFRRVDG